jgi:hypothetical protein
VRSDTTATATPAAHLVAGALAVLVAWSWRCGRILLAGANDDPIPGHVHWAPAVHLALFGVAAGDPTRHPLAIGYWFVAVSSEVAWYLFGAAVATRLQAWGASLRMARTLNTQPPAPVEPAKPAESSDIPDLANLLGQQRRYLTPAGLDTVYGRAIVRFAPGQRTAQVHVPVSPPFARRPEVDAEPCDGAPLSVEASQVLHHGVRFDVRLDAATNGPVAHAFDYQLVFDPSGGEGGDVSGELVADGEDG